MRQDSEPRDVGPVSLRALEEGRERPGREWHRLTRFSEQQELVIVGMLVRRLGGSVVLSRQDFVFHKDAELVRSETPEGDVVLAVRERRK